jgi:hypothetical protein
VELQALIPGIVGAGVGVIGWLFVGMFIQRRQFLRQARSAARAVYFELEVNRVAVTVAREHGTFNDLDRSSFERLLPELAAMLSATDLQAVVTAYMAHAGYRQLASESGSLPAQVRSTALAGIIEAQVRAEEVLRRSAFTPDEARAMARAADAGAESAPTEAHRREAVR